MIKLKKKHLLGILLPILLNLDWNITIQIYI
jgi:hypothetical protein